MMSLTNKLNRLKPLSGFVAFFITLEDDYFEKKDFLKIEKKIIRIGLISFLIICDEEATQKKKMMEYRKQASLLEGSL